MSLYQHGVCRSATAQGTQAEALLAFLGLLVEPACQPDASFLALDGCGCEALPGLPCEVSMNGVSSKPTLEVEGNSIEAIHYPWIFYQQISGRMCMPNAGTVGSGHGLPPRRSNKLAKKVVPSSTGKRFQVPLPTAL
jgi:hypothetical protein